MMSRWRKNISSYIRLILIERFTAYVNTRDVESPLGASPLPNVRSFQCATAATRESIKRSIKDASSDFRLDDFECKQKSIKHSKILLRRFVFRDAVELYNLHLIVRSEIVRREYRT